MATIVIVTSSFPFPGGEQFLESEIEFWGSSLDRVILLPAIARGVPRVVPAGIEVDLTLARFRTRSRKVAYLLSSPFSKILLKEVIHLRQINKFNRKSLYQAALSTSQALMAARGLRKAATTCGGIDLVYSYWNDTESYGAAISKRQGYVKHVVARAHRYDLYEELRADGYMPVKRQFIDDFDALCPISQHGHDYIADVYRMSPERNIVSFLGVHIPERETRVSEGAQCHIVSVSLCVQVKRIDKIIEALAFAAESRSDISFTWTHVGGGPLLNALQERAETALSRLENVCHVFMGHMSNEDALRFLLDEPIDMLINTSESEGIAVSIMEAMSCGIPAIAPDVGGVSELVGNGRGVLMSSLPEVDEIAGHLIGFRMVAKRRKTRQMVRAFVADEFNADRNYRAFVERCAQIARLADGVAGASGTPLSATPETLGD